MMHKFRIVDPDDAFELVLLDLVDAASAMSGRLLLVILLRVSFILGYEVNVIDVQWLILLLWFLVRTTWIECVEDQAGEGLTQT